MTGDEFSPVLHYEIAEAAGVILVENSRELQ